MICRQIVLLYSTIYPCINFLIFPKKKSENFKSEKKKREKKKNYFVLCLVLFLLVGCVTLCIYELSHKIKKFFKKIKAQSYIVYKKKGSEF